MIRKSKMGMGMAALLSVGLYLALAARGAESPGPQKLVAEPIPAYHPQVPAGPLPETLRADQFDIAEIENAYAIAGRIKRTLYQQPCYCHCDRSQGHGSLLDCFVSRHASGCEICMREAFFAAEQIRKGKNAAQIRAAIVQGDWQGVDVAKYQTYPAGK